MGPASNDQARASIKRVAMGYFLCLTVLVLGTIFARLTRPWVESKLSLTVRRRLSCWGLPAIVIGTFIGLTFTVNQDWAKVAATMVGLFVWIVFANFAARAILVEGSSATSV